MACSGIDCQWQGDEKRRKGELELPHAMLLAFHNLYYNPANNAEHHSKSHRTHSILPQEKRLRTVVNGYTEYVLEKHVRYRVHPNYKSNGPWYNWAIIKCPHDNIDLVCNPDPSWPTNPPAEGEGPPSVEETIFGKGKREGTKTVVRPVSYCETKYGPQHVPAKVVVLLCRQETKKNHQQRKPWITPVVLGCKRTMIEPPH